MYYIFVSISFIFVAVVLFVCFVWFFLGGAFGIVNSVKAAAKIDVMA